MNREQLYNHEIAVENIAMDCGLNHDQAGERLERFIGYLDSRTMNELSNDCELLKWWLDRTGTVSDHKSTVCTLRSIQDVLKDRMS